MKRITQPLQVFLAIKMLGLHEGLLDSDRRVAILLLEHYNRRTGRCDPSIERLAKLLGLSERTIMRSIVRLVRLKLFVKVRHGGYSNRNRYEPNWSLFDDLRTRWKKRFSERSRSTRESSVASQPSHLPSDARVTQTYSSNQLKQTYLGGSANKEKVAHPSKTLGQPSNEASRVAAQRRWDHDLLQHFRNTANEYACAVEVIDKALAEQASDAELQRRGAGLELILRSIASKLDGAGT